MTNLMWNLSSYSVSHPKNCIKKWLKLGFCYMPLQTYYPEDLTDYIDHDLFGSTYQIQDMILLRQAWLRVNLNPHICNKFKLFTCYIQYFATSLWGIQFLIRKTRTRTNQLFQFFFYFLLIRTSKQDNPQ